MNRHSAARLGLATAVAISVAVTLLCRWRWAANADGPQLRPRPDALEYVASAQAIAQSGSFYLQLGPDRVRSRYAPGWPLLLAGALRLGVPPTALWRVAGVFGALLSATLCLMSWLLTDWIWRRVLMRSGDTPLVALTVAGLGGGLAWALSPGAISVGRTVMSDEPTAAISTVGLLAAGWLLSRGSEGAARARAALAAAAGLALGLAVAMRPVEGALLGAAMVVGLGTAWIRTRLPSRTELVLFTASALIFPLAAMALLRHSGESPWQLTAYGLWLGDRSASAPTFDWRYALQGSDRFSPGSYGGTIPNLALALLVLLGLPGLRSEHTLAMLWPIAGWCVGWFLLRFARRHADRQTADAIAVAAGLASTWVLAHVGCFALYFFPHGRFYLGPFAVVSLLSAIGAGLFVAQAATRNAALARAAILAGLLACVGWRAARFAAETKRRFKTQDVASRVGAWLSQTDAQRARRPIPFDPIEAQALGLLPPETCAGIKEWGVPRDTFRMRQQRDVARTHAGRPDS